MAAILEHYIVPFARIREQRDVEVTFACVRRIEFDSSSGKLLKEAPGAGYPIVAIQMSPDGQRVFAYTIDDFSFAPVSMSVWDVTSGKVAALTVDPKTCVGAGMSRSHLLLIQQDAAKTLTVASVQ